MKNCIFCKIIKGKEPARIVYEDKDVKIDTWPKLPKIKVDPDELLEKLKI
ncbi:MAG: HIT family protein [Minisyncoccia bacterium]|jgi:diadenosine tetraphosphate (Ap4A) HIT family hydrolase